MSDKMRIFVGLAPSKTDQLKDLPEQSLQSEVMDQFGLSDIAPGTINRYGYISGVINGVDAIDRVRELDGVEWVEIDEAMKAF